MTATEAVIQFSRLYELHGLFETIEMSDFHASEPQAGSYLLLSRWADEAPAIDGSDLITNAVVKKAYFTSLPPN